MGSGYPQPRESDSSSEILEAWSLLWSQSRQSRERAGESRVSFWRRAMGRAPCNECGQRVDALLDGLGETFGTGSWRRIPRYNKSRTVSSAQSRSSVGVLRSVSSSCRYIPAGNIACAATGCVSTGGRRRETNDYCGPRASRCPLGFNGAECTPFPATHGRGPCLEVIAPGRNRNPDPRGCVDGGSIGCLGR
jgi:hypothetical protein